MIINNGNLGGIYQGFNTLFNKGFENTEAQYGKISMIVPSGGADETYAWLGQFPTLREWITEREIYNLVSCGYTIRNKDYELTISVPRNDIMDDKIGIYSPLIQNMGESAKMHPDTLVFPLLAKGFQNPCYDKANFFSDKHPLYLWDDCEEFQSNIGTEQLNPASYEAARSQMMCLKGENELSLKIVPDLLVVAPQKEAIARKILFADLISGNTNTNKGTCELLVSPELADYPEQWYLLATKRSIKPLIFQTRENPRFTSKTQDSDDNVFFNNEFIYGCNARYNAGYGLWQLAYGSTGTTLSKSMEHVAASESKSK